MRHSSIHNFSEEKPVRTMSLYPLALYKGDQNLKLDESTLFSMHQLLKYKWNQYLAMRTLVFVNQLTLCPCPLKF